MTQFKTSSDCPVVSPRTNALGQQARDRTTDALTIKNMAQGHWRDILVAAGFTVESLDGKNHACPKCGGKDRFRFIDEDAGAVLCNQCFRTQNGDGLAAIQWLRDCSFNEACQFVAAELGQQGDTVDTTPPISGKNGVLSASTEMANKNCTSTSRSNRNTSTPVYATRDEALAALTRQLGNPTRDWDYYDAEGELKGTVIRFDPAGGKKEFRPLSACQGGWQVKDMPQPKPLYGLLTLTDAHTVYVVEGEKAADALQNLGLVAVTSSGGSGRAKETDWSPLAGKQVVILPDNDSPGQKYADDVHKLLRGVSPPPAIKQLDLPGLNEAEDVVDWIGHQDTTSLEELRASLGQLVMEASVDAPMTSDDKVTTWSPFPVELLPTALRDFVVEASSAIGCDPSFVALPLLAAAGAAIGASRCLEVKSGWRVPPVLWTMFVGPSGTSKSPAMKAALQPAYGFHEQWLVENNKQLRECQVAERQYRKDLRAWEKSKDASAIPPFEPTPPVAKRNVVENTTVEALVPVLQQNPRGILLANAELSSWLGGFDRYAAGKGNSDASQWLKMHCGDTIVVDRKTGPQPTISVPMPLVSITGGIQPDVLKNSMAGEHTSSGLTARFLFAYPPVVPKKWKDDEISIDSTRGLAELFAKLYGLNLATDGCGRAVPTVLEYAPDAKRAFIEFYNRNAEEQADLRFQREDQLSSAWSKLEEYAARLALIIHIVRLLSGETNSDVVDLASIRPAITLTDWFKQEARRVYALFAGTVQDLDDHRLVEWIAARGGSVTAREVHRGNRRYSACGSALAALQHLEERGYGKIETVETGCRGGRPGPRFRLKPTQARSDLTQGDSPAGRGADD